MLDGGKILFAGKLDTVSGHARRFGTPKQTVAHRLARGFSLSDAIHSPPRSGKPNPIEAFGECLPIAEWSRRYNIPESTIRGRLALGWDAEEAVSTIPDGSMTAFGKTQSYAQWAREYGMAPSTLRQRVLRGGMPPEVALIAPIMGRTK